MSRPLAVAGALLVVPVAALLLAPRSPAVATFQDEPEGTPGLLLTVESFVKGWNGPADRRDARLASLHVPAGASPTPFLPPGPFRATWTADLVLDFKGEFTFSAEGRGSMTLLLNGKPVLKAKGEDLSKTPPKKIELPRENKLEVRYESPEKGDATFRLYWASEEFHREPLGLASVRHDPKSAPLVRGQQLRQGREALATLHCLNCHSADVKGMPDLAEDAPSFADLGARLRPGWVARWVQDPHALRPTATMPRLLTDAGTGLEAKLDPRAGDIASYLASLGKPAAEEKPADAKAVAAGTRLFVNLGCYGCHVQPGRDDYAEDEHKRIPLRDAGAKYQPGALKAFLQQPEKHYGWIRMPNFRLTDAEASSLTAFLRSVKPRDLLADPKGDAGKGKEQVASLGCLNCHSLNAERPTGSTLKPPALAALTKGHLAAGCLAEKPGKAPAFAFQKGDREAIRLCLEHGRDALGREAVQEFAERQVKSLRCAACHKRDGADDVMSALKDDAAGLEADLPPGPPEKEGMYTAEQVKPGLTYIGEKLRPEWLVPFLAGKIPYKPRPWLRSRMPGFPRRAELLGKGLAFEHGYSDSSPKPPKPDPKLADAGSRLASKARWGCVSCHDVGKVAAVGVFEAPGVNFMYVTDRLRHPYYDRWLWNPLRLEPGTKMPQVYNVGQPSQIKDILGGDPQKQIDALWNYLLRADQIKPPAQ